MDRRSADLYDPAADPIVPFADLRTLPTALLVLPCRAFGIARLRPPTPQARAGAAAATTPQIETDLLSYGKATVCRRISSMHSRAYPKRTLDL